jgi:transcriptional regulator with XRE-family HTH domain
MASRKSRTLEEAFGRVVQARRNAKGISQEELGFEAGLHRTFVSQLERGLKSPSLRTLFAIAKALEARPDSLVRDAERLWEES